MSQRDLYDEGFDHGYQYYLDGLVELENLRSQNEALRALIAANYRGMKEEIRKELATDHHTN